MAGFGLIVLLSRGLGELKSSFWEVPADWVADKSKLSGVNINENCNL